MSWAVFLFIAPFILLSLSRGWHDELNE